MIDLHTHSTASDGSLSPSALIDLAVDRKLLAIALTDHDTVAGIPEAEARAAEKGIRFIRGVEIEIAFAPGEFHLLGLDIRVLDGELGHALTGLGAARAQRNRRIVERIVEAGIPATMGELETIAGLKPGEGRAAAAAMRIGRPHIASLLVSKKAAKNRQDAFDRYIGKGRPFYEPKECLPLVEAIRLVKESGGLAIVAHPYSLFVSKGRLASLLDEWKELGIDGIEAFHPTAKLGQCRILERLARARDFRVTAGSDYHGLIRPERKLGLTAGRIPIADEFLEELKR